MILIFDNSSGIHISLVRKTACDMCGQIGTAVVFECTDSKGEHGEPAQAIFCMQHFGDLTRAIYGCRRLET